MGGCIKVEAFDIVPREEDFVSLAQGNIEQII